LVTVRCLSTQNTSTQGSGPPHDIISARLRLSARLPSSSLRSALRFSQPSDGFFRAQTLRAYCIPLPCPGFLFPLRELLPLCSRPSSSEVFCPHAVADFVYSPASRLPQTLSRDFEALLRTKVRAVSLVLPAPLAVPLFGLRLLQVTHSPRQWPRLTRSQTLMTLATRPSS
jgi:hypothetical protein